MDQNSGFLPKGLQDYQIYLRNVPYLTDEDRVVLGEKGKLIKLSRSKILFQEGEEAVEFFLIVSGILKLQRQSQNSHTLIDLVGDHEVIGGGLMQGSEKTLYPITAKAMSACELLSFPKEFYFSYWQKRPNLNQYLMSQMAKRIQSLQMEKNLQRFHLEEKLAYYLTEKISKFPHLRITRQDLADAVGATNESVIRVLSEWNKLGLVTSEHQEIQIHHPEKLREKWKKD